MKNKIEEVAIDLHRILDRNSDRIEEVVEVFCMGVVGEALLINKVKHYQREKIIKRLEGAVKILSRFQETALGRSE